MANGQVEDRAGSRFPPPYRPSAASSRTETPVSARASSPARATTLIRSHSEKAYGDTQRHAQSAAAIYKLRQASGGSNNSPRSLSQDHFRGAETHNIENTPLARDSSYSKIVTGGQSSSYANVAAKNPRDDGQSKNPQLWVDTSREEDTTQVAGRLVSPLEVLKLTTGLSTEQPAWAQPFPTPSVSETEREEQATTAITNTSTTAGVYSPFGLGFEGGIRRASSAKEPMSNSSASGGVWGSSNASNNSLSSFPVAASTIAASSSSSFASIDAIFSQRNDSSDALAGLLGVHLDSNSLAHGVLLTVPPKGEHTSRFSFANPADIGRGGRQQAPARYELLDGTTVKDCSSFGGFDAAHFGDAASASSGLVSSTDGSGFPPLGSSGHQLHHSPPPSHPSRSLFGSDFRNGDPPHSGGGALGESSGLAFLQQMLPNVNISLGGDYLSVAGPGSSGVDAATTPAHSLGAGRGRAGRRLFERSQSAGGNSVSPDSWDGGSLSSLGFDGQSSSRRASSGSLFYDSALVAQSSNGLSSNFYSFNSSSSMPPNDSESERLCMHGDFGGDTFRSSSLINNS